MLDSGRIQFMTSIMKYSISRPPTGTDGIAIATRGFFNNRHMANISNWSPEIHPNLLLIGNSIVLGGDTSNPEERLGPLLEKDLGGRYTAWSVAANNWSNVNEMTYHDRNADVLITPMP
jgi:hypothetical protein